ncbi:MAG: hypothetical protein L0210_02800, partial [Rhodospirillales bacterium]|nr:hypothetical protein [Rhodospirillales bacterium]
LVTDDPTGALVLTRAGSRRVRGRLKLGENILAGRGSFSQRQRYSHYVVRGQRASDDATDDVDEFASPEGKACDTEIGRFRELILVNEIPGDRFEHRRRAEWEATRRAGLSLQAGYTVQGWRDPSGALWEPNTLVSVIDEWLGIERDLLIVSTEFTLSSEGSKTEMELAPKEAYEPMPEVPEAANKGFAIASSAADTAVARRSSQRRS